jgi:hypothetical protein
MSNNKPQHPANYRVRGSDRRICAGIKQPPYTTRDGLVEYDRRSQLDRRATWLREFSIDVSNH